MLSTAIFYVAKLFQALALISILIAFIYHFPHLMNQNIFWIGSIVFFGRMDFRKMSQPMIRWIKNIILPVRYFDKSDGKHILRYDSGGKGFKRVSYFLWFSAIIFLLWGVLFLVKMF